MKARRVLVPVKELAPDAYAARTFRVDVRVSAPQLEDWLTVVNRELDVFDALHIFRMWCRRVRRGTRVGREYKPSAVRIRLCSENGHLTIAQWGEPGE